MPNPVSLADGDLLLYERMRALAVTRADAERSAPGTMAQLQRSCAGCGDKPACKTDLAARPDDSVWKGYCPNSAILESLASAKGGTP